METRRNLRLSLYDPPLEYRSAYAAQIVRHSGTMEPYRQKRHFYVAQRRRKKRKDHRCKWKDCCKCCSIIWKCLTSIWTSLSEVCCRLCRGPREEPLPPYYSGAFSLSHLPPRPSTSTKSDEDIDFADTAV